MFGLTVEFPQCVRPSAVFVLLCAPFVSSAASAATEKPLFELGLGVGALNQPYYPGTRDTRNVVFPAPLPVYRGRVFKSDSRGMRAQVVDEPRYRLAVSMDINLAIDSDDIDLRAGMEDIDTMLQVGPALEIDLFQGQHNQLKLNLPVRLNLGVSSRRWSDNGATFSPNISWHHRFDWQEIPWTANVSIGPQFGTSQFHDVYYSVANRDATEERPVYRATGGYSGSRFTASLRSRNERRLWVVFARYDWLAGAEFESSPLVEIDHGFTIGLIYSRFVFRSKTKVAYD